MCMNMHVLWVPLGSILVCCCSDPWYFFSKKCTWLSKVQWYRCCRTACVLLLIPYFEVQTTSRLLQYSAVLFGHSFCAFSVPSLTPVYSIIVCLAWIICRPNLCQTHWASTCISRHGLCIRLRRLPITLWSSCALSCCFCHCVPCVAWEDYFSSSSRYDKLTGACSFWSCFISSIR